MAAKSKTTAEEARIDQEQASKEENVYLYTKEDFIANPASLGASRDIVDAALTEKGIEKAGLDEAKKIVKEFRERKVN